MGIFDGVLGGQSGIAAATNAAQGLVGQSYQDQLAQQYSNALGQSMVNTKNAMAQSIMAQAQVIKPFNPNDEPAFNVPLSQLVTLWQAHYGDQWVERFDEDFWANARLRLHENDKLEAVNGWFRIKEDA